MHANTNPLLEFTHTPQVPSYTRIYSSSSSTLRDQKCDLLRIVPEALVGLADAIFDLRSIHGARSLVLAFL